MSIVGKVLRDMKRDKVTKHYNEKNRLIPHKLYQKLKHITRCEICNKKIILPEIHHIIPVKNGGLNIRENLLALCKECHEKMDKND